MNPQPRLTEGFVADREAVDTSRLYLEGIIAGFIGAATIAVWFLILDTIHGRPLYTPSLLGTALFHRGGWPAPPEVLPVSLEMALMYTWVHFLVFCILGGIASRLLGLAEQNLNIGFGIVLLFIVFEFGFIGAALVFSEAVLKALAWLPPPHDFFGHLIGRNVREKNPGGVHGEKTTATRSFLY
ncbi:MAG TPA: hypothetical protein VNL14_02220 [Candidatus Acidoferrales bacterium]|nr:hypothetical protein [Candidatus Acidoferrales bacterium]